MESDLEAARQRALARVAREPGAALALYEAACAHDRLGLEREAVPFYEGALAAGLAGEDLRGACLGLGSTYRVLGEYARALEVLERGLAAFPRARDLGVFRAMALYNLGRSKEAVAALLLLLAEAPGDPEVTRYARAIALYADDLDRTWP